MKKLLFLAVIIIISFLLKGCIVSSDDMRTEEEWQAIKNPGHWIYYKTIEREKKDFFHYTVKKVKVAAVKYDSKRKTIINKKIREIESEKVHLRIDKYIVISHILIVVLLLFIFIITENMNIYYMIKKIIIILNILITITILILLAVMDAPLENIGWFISLIGISNIFQIDTYPKGIKEMNKNISYLKRTLKFHGLVYLLPLLIIVLN